MIMTMCSSAFPADCKGISAQHVESDAGATELYMPAHVVPEGILIFHEVHNIMMCGPGLVS